METKNKNYDLRKLLKPYENKWVALSSDRRRVLAHGDNAETVINKAQKKDSIVFKVFSTETFYMPFSA